MDSQLYAFEPRIGLSPAMRPHRTLNYTSGRFSALHRFLAKSQHQSQALLGLEVGGA